MPFGYWLTVCRSFVWLKSLNSLTLNFVEYLFCPLLSVQELFLAEATKSIMSPLEQ